MSAMHPDHYPARYTTSSPLSPKISTRQVPPPSLNRHRPTASKSATRDFHTDMPAHSTSVHGSSSAATPSTHIQSPAISFHRRLQPTPMEIQQRVMSRGQRNFLKQLQLSSTLAASPMSDKPDAPRLDPLGSPNGAVTPLALEQVEAGDYFFVARTGKYSPASSPGGRKSRSDGHGKEEVPKKKTTLYR